MDQVGDVVLVAEPGPRHAASTATLGAELRHRGGLDVAGGAHREHQLLIVDEVLDVEIARVVDELGPTRRGVRRADLDQFLLEHLAQASLVGEDRLEFGDLDDQFGQAFLEVRPAQPGEADQLHVEDVVGLDLGELVRAGHQPLAGGSPVGGAADEGDDGVDVAECRQEPLGDV